MKEKQPSHNTSSHYISLIKISLYIVCNHERAVTVITSKCFHYSPPLSSLHKDIISRREAALFWIRQMICMKITLFFCTAMTHCFYFCFISRTLCKSASAFCGSIRTITCVAVLVILHSKTFNNLFLFCCRRLISQLLQTPSPYLGMSASWGRCASEWATRRLWSRCGSLWSR